MVSIRPKSVQVDRTSLPNDQPSTTPSGSKCTKEFHLTTLRPVLESQLLGPHMGSTFGTLHGVYLGLCTVPTWDPAWDQHETGGRTDGRAGQARAREPVDGPMGGWADASSSEKIYYTSIKAATCTCIEGGGGGSRGRCKWNFTCIKGGEGGSTPLQVNLHLPKEIQTRPFSVQFSKKQHFGPK